MTIERNEADRDGVSVPPDERARLLLNDMSREGISPPDAAKALINVGLAALADVEGIEKVILSLRIMASIIEDDLAPRRDDQTAH